MTRQDLIQRLTAIIDGQSVLRESLPIMPPDQCRDAIHQQLQLLRALRSDVESQGVTPPRVTAFDKVEEPRRRAGKAKT